MTDAIQLFIAGHVPTQGSVRGFVANGRVIVKSSDAKLGEFRATLAAEVRRLYPNHEPFTGPVDLAVVVRLPRPKSHWRTGKHAHELRPDAPVWPARTPDIDKILRGVLDALTYAGVWGDDAQVVQLTGVKKWAADGWPPGTGLEVCAL